MLKIKKIIITWYGSKNRFKFFLSCLLSYLFFLTCPIVTNLINSIKILLNIKKYKLVNSPFCALIDMAFCNLFLGYSPIQYVTYSFYKLSLKDKLSFIPTFEYVLFSRLLNIDCDIEILSDKYKTYMHLKNLFGRELIVIKNKNDFPVFVNFINKHNNFFYKPLNGLCGINSGLANKNNIDVKSFFIKLISIGSFVIEEKIEQCKELASFHPSSVNTVRIVTFRSKEGPELLYGCLRCGQGKSVVDNGGAGGIFIPLNLDDGRLIKMGFDESGNKYTSHPDTNILFENFQIPYFEEVKSLALTAANQLSGIRYIGWDIAISKDNIIIVEGNSFPTLLILEAFHKTGFKNELRKIVRTAHISESFRDKQKDLFF